MNLEFFLPRLLTLLHIQTTVPNGSTLLANASHAELYALFTGREDNDDWREMEIEAERNLIKAAKDNALILNDSLTNLSTTSDSATAIANININTMDNTNNTAPQVFSLKQLTIATHQIELLFVICALLVGKRKNQVQDFFATNSAVRVYKITII